MRSDGPVISLGDAEAETASCLSCRERVAEGDLDRARWCAGCRRFARERAGWWGWAGGLGIGLALAAYIWVAIQPSAGLLGAWFGIVAMGIWLGSKVCRELAYGVIRYRERTLEPSLAAEPRLEDDG